MSIFKNVNESAYVGGRKHWTDVIKNSGAPNMLIWRQPEEDFNTNSTLVVMPGEEAIFVNGGIIEQVFYNGTYKLNTDNYPFISRLKNMFSGGVSTFNCVVYFVRKTHSMEILWGTSSPIQVRDKLLGISTKIRARGAYKIQVSNPSQFLTKLVGDTAAYVEQQEILDKFFANEFQSKIKSELTKYLNEMNAELLGVEAKMDKLAESVTPYLESSFEEYGIKLIMFTISAMDIDDDELRRKYDEIGMESIRKLRTAQADKNVMGILGDDWGRQQAANILSDLAANPGAGGVAAAGAGMGMGIGAGGAFSSMAQQMFTPITNINNQANPPYTSSSRFQQSDDTYKIVDEAQKQDPVAVLSNLKRMLDAGLIEQSEYDGKKREILEKMGN